MGGQQSHDDFNQRVTRASQSASHAVNQGANLYGQMLVAQQKVQQGKTGGFFGGSEDSSSIVAELKSYRASSAAKAKEEAVRRMARGLSKEGFKINPDADLDTIVAEMRAVLPNPKHRKTFSADAKEQKVACEAVARAINDQWTPGASPSNRLIDTTAGPEYVCRRVAELVHSMASGVHTEFLEVQVGVKKALQDLAALNEFVGAMHTQAVKELQEGASSLAQRKAEPFEEAYSRLRQEIDFTMKKLQGFLHITIAPAEEELQILMAEEGDLYNRLKRDNLIPGTSEFGDALAYALTGLGTLAAIATRTQRALKEVGLDAEQYANSSSWDDLDDLINRNRDNVSIDDLGKFEQASEQLRKTFWRHDEIADAMKSGVSGKVGYSKRADNLADDEFLGEGEFVGGAHEKLDSRIERRKLERKLILRQYFERSRRAYDKLLSAVQVVGPKLGREIPVTDRLDALRDALTRLNNLNIPKLDLSLIGFYTSAQARAGRESFLNQLRQVSRAVDEASASETYRDHAGVLQPIREAIDELIRTIDYYADVVAKKYGGVQGPATEDAHAVGVAVVADPPQATGAEGDASADNEEDVIGGADEVDLTELRLSEQLRSSLDLKSAVNDFVYYFFVAKVYENLKLTSKELEEYGSKYEDVLGDAVAGRLQAVEKEYTTILDESGVGDAAHIGAKPAGAAGTEWEKAKASLQEEYKTKMDFYRLLQAIDLYMKAFARGVASDSEAVLDIKKQLNGVDTIAKWFVEDTGNHLTRFFDLSRQLGSNDPGQSGDVPTGGEHYYVNVQSAAGKIGGGGAVNASKAEEMRGAVGSALNNFQALKNMMNAFVRLGAKFGGVELQRQSGMTAREMYRTMINYLRVSSVSTRVLPRPGMGGVFDANIAGVPTSQAGSQTEANRMCYITPAAANGALVGNWAVENKFFQFIVKCISAKILVVLGVFDLFERPEPLYELTPTRIIIGGDDSAPEVIPAATELYFRLPRLAEFYLNLFDFGAGGNDEKISMLPEMEGVFAGLITQIFVKSRAVAESGDYSDIETEALISVINGIYEHYRGHGADATKKALEDFVAEINRRYGIIKRDDWNKLQKLLGETRINQPGDASSKNNYAILPNEDGIFLDEGKRMAPSDRFLGPGASSSTKTSWVPGKFHLDTDFGGDSMWGILGEFRTRLKKILTEGHEKDYGQTSYRLLIDQARRDIERADSSRSKLEVVYRLIQGSSLVTGTDQGNALMFHETVVVGLNMLTAIFDQLDAFRRRMNDMNAKAITDSLVTWLTADPAAGGPANAADITRDNAIAWLTRRVGAGVDRYIRVADATELTRIFPEPLCPDGSDQTLNDLWLWAWGAYRQPDWAPAVARLVVDRQLIMRDLVVTLFQLTSDFDEMVTVRFPGAANSKIHVDFSKVRDVVEGLLSDVRKFLNTFRATMSADTIKRFEASDNRGSLHWLEKHLVDGLMKGFTTAAGAATDDNQTLERVGRAVNDCFVALTSKHEGQTIDIQPAGINGALVNAAGDAQYDQYGRVFSQLVHWDALAVGNNSGVAGGVGFENTLSTYIAGPLLPGAAAGARNPPLQTTGGADVNHYYPTYEARNLTGNRSMLFMFNQILNMYLGQFLDAPSAKIYQGLIDAFANGSFSQAVMVQGYSQPDMTNNAVAATFGVRGDPTGRSVLLTSLATVLQRLVKDQTSQGMSKHLVATLAEVPAYLKENYRASLPIFVKMFELVGKQGELIKQLIQRGQVQCGRPSLFNRSGAAAVGGVAADVVARIGSAGGLRNVNKGAADVDWPAGSMQPEITLHTLGGVDQNTNAVVGPRIISVIDGVTSGCYTMSKIGQEVLRELADEPLYYQTSLGSIQEYKSRYGKLPLMPLSLSLFPLRDLPNTNPTGSVGLVNSDSMMPQQAVGAPDFQRLYGNRGILAVKQKASLESMPGVRSLLMAYNAGASARDKIEESQFAQYAGRVTSALRYLVDTRSYRAVLVDSTETYGGAQLFSPDGGTVNDNMRAYALRTTTTGTQVLEVTDSSYQEEKVADMTSILASAGGSPQLASGAARQAERVKNIIDMNIMPIDVHALMRSMALANVYNYGFTFEEMVCLFYGQSRSVINGMSMAGAPEDPAAAPGADRGAPRTTKEFFLKLLLDPYGEVGAEQYGDERAVRGTAGFVQRICRGDNDLAMGRPKFISDQLFNKVMFGSIYPTQYDYDEAGPSGLIERGRRGADAWGNPATADARGYYAGLVAVSNIITNTIPVIITRLIQGMDAAGAHRVTGVTLARAIQRVGGRYEAGRGRYADAVAAAPIAGTDLVALYNQAIAETTTARDGAGQIGNNGSLAQMSGAIVGPNGAWGTAADVRTEMNNAGVTNLVTLSQEIADGAVGGGVGNLPVGLQIPNPAGIAPWSIDFRILLIALGVSDDEIDAIVGIPLAGAGGNANAGRDEAARAVAPFVARHLNAQFTTVANTIRQLMVKSMRLYQTNEDRTLLGPDTVRYAQPPTNMTPERYLVANVGDTPLGNMLTYIGTKGDGEPDWSVVKQVGMGAFKGQLLAVGRDRFNSALVRNLMLITNVYRLTRAKLNRDLAQTRTIVQRGDSLVAPGLTEYRYNQDVASDTSAYFSERTMLA